MKRYILIVLLISYMGLIYFFSSLPQPPGLFLPAIPARDKFLHLLEYLPLSFLWYKVLKNYRLLREQLSFLFSFFYAISDELHQFYVPLRQSSSQDLVFDIIGIILGIKLAQLIPWSKYEHSKAYSSIALK